MDLHRTRCLGQILCQLFLDEAAHGQFLGLLFTLAKAVDYYNQYCVYMNHAVIEPVTDFIVSCLGTRYCSKC